MTMSQTKKGVISLKKGAVKILLLVVVMVLAMFGCSSNGGNNASNGDKTFSTGLYSIVLPNNFKDKTEEGWELIVGNKDVVVLFSSVQKKYLIENGYAEDYSRKDFTQDIIGTDTVIEQSEKANYNTFSYRSQDEGGDFYFLVGVYETDKLYLGANFVCDYSKMDEYKPLFEDWAGKVKFK